VSPQSHGGHSTVAQARPPCGADSQTCCATCYPLACMLLLCGCGLSVHLLAGGLFRPPRFNLALYRSRSRSANVGIVCPAVLLPSGGSPSPSPSCTVLGLLLARPQGREYPTLAGDTVGRVPIEWLRRCFAGAGAAGDEVVMGRRPCRS
jgi:hypothetical protein